MSSRTGLLGVLVPDETTRRAFEETMADWREEWTRASNPIARIAAATRGWVSLARVLVGTMRVGFQTRSTWSFLAGTVMTSAALSLLLIDSVWSSTGWPLLSFSNIALAVLMLIPQGQAVLVAPIAAMGLGLRPRQPLSPLTIVPALVLGMVLLVGWLLPASNQMYREYMFSKYGGDEALANGLPELSLPDLIRQAANGSTYESFAAIGQLSTRIALVAAVPISFVFGIAVRRRLDGLVRWGIARFLAGGTVIGLFLAWNFVMSQILRALPGLATFRPRSLGIWLSLVCLSAATVLLCRTPNPEPDAGTRNPAPGSPNP